MTQTAYAAASRLLRKSDPDAGRAISHLGLQLLLYYAQGWHLCVRDEPLFADRIEAWPAGPILPALWERLGARDALALDPNLADDDAAGALAPHSADILDLVWDAYQPIAVWTLRNLAKSEAPWINARGALSEKDSTHPEIPAAAQAAFFGGLRDRLLDTANLGAVTRADDLDWLAAAMKKHQER